MEGKKLTAIILAAGKGTRMKSKYPKVLHECGGQPMLGHVLDAAEKCGCKNKLVVVGHEAELVEKYVGDRARIVLQTEQLGTGHAVLQTEESLKGVEGTVLILCGDTPLLDGGELCKFAEEHQKSGAAASVLTAVMDNPFGYGRIIRNADGQVEGIVEQKDATPEQLAIHEINTGIYCAELPLLFEVLHTLRNDNAQGEYYLTDILAKLNAMGKKVTGVVTPDEEMTMGINSRRQLAVAEAAMRRRVLERLMDDGVTVMDPNSTYVEKSVKVGRDTVLYPGTWLQGISEIGEDCKIGPYTRVANSKVGNGCTLHYVYAHECEVKEGVTAGPFVHFRPGSVIGKNVKVGNFVEVKNSNIGECTKLPHLQYIGDSDVGKGVNIGCGCITVNYDGYKKHRTVIGDNAFVGCNSNLVAPVTVEANSYVAAGSTITKNVPEGALGICRSEQKNFSGWVEKYAQRKRAEDLKKTSQNFEKKV